MAWPDRLISPARTNTWCNLWNFSHKLAVGSVFLAAGEWGRGSTRTAWPLTEATIPPTINRGKEYKMPSKTKIGLLVAGHGCAVLLLGCAVFDDIWNYPTTFCLFALVLAEGGLLGIWGALGTSRLLWRALVVITTTACIWSVFLFLATQGIWDSWDRWYSAQIAFQPAFIALILSRLRYGRYRLCLTRSITCSPSAERLQFTIQHILVITLAVAVLLAIGPACRTLAEKTQEDREFSLSVAVISPCLISVALAMLWGALGIGRPTARLAVAVPAAFLVGFIPPFYLIMIFENGWRDYAIWSAIFGLQAIITAASLLVVRSCGWRLVSGEGNTAPPRA